MKIEKASLKEPNSEQREIKIRIIYIKCTECDTTFKITPCGVVHDPERDLYLEEDALLEDHAKLTNNQKIQLKNELV